MKAGIRQKTIDHIRTFVLFYYHSVSFLIESFGLQFMELEQTFSTELDLPPEYCRYKDEGCELAESCLNCPFPRCIYDEPGGKQHLLKRQRDGEIVRLFKDKGKEVKELALVFGVSHRTVQRALKNHRTTQAGQCD